LVAYDGAAVVVEFAKVAAHLEDVTGVDWLEGIFDIGVKIEAVFSRLVR